MEQINQTNGLTVNEALTALLPSRVQGQQPTTSNFETSYLEGLSYSTCLDYLRYYVRRRVMSLGKEYAETADFKQALEDTAKWLTFPGERKNLFLCGSVGCGKTTLASAAYSVIKDYLDITMKYNNALKMSMQWKKVSIREKLMLNLQKLPETMQELILCPQLILDDVGSEPVELNYYGTIMTPTTDVLCGRYDRLGKRTIITTNLTPKEFGERYGKRAADRMRETYKVICVGYDSFRK